jgi:hypothetical protein
MGIDLLVGKTASMFRVNVSHVGEWVVIHKWAPEGSTEQSEPGEEDDGTETGRWEPQALKRETIPGWRKSKKVPLCRCRGKRNKESFQGPGKRKSRGFF